MWAGILFSAVLSLGAVTPALVLADEGAPTENHREQRRQVKAGAAQVVVQVRIVRAEQKFENVDAAVNANAVAPHKVAIDGRLRDLAPRLRRLPYGAFSLVWAEKRVMPLKRKEIIAMNSGQTLTLRPIAIEDEQVEMLLRWQDQSGSSILDTRMHFDTRESVLAGTESGTTGGVILAIDVSPIAP